MNLKDFKKIAEDKDSYTVEHPSGKKLFIEKAKLSDSAHKHIRCMASGGQFDGGDSTASDQAVSDLGGGDPTAGVPRTPVVPYTPQQISDMGGGDPIATLDSTKNVAAGNDIVPGAWEPMSDAPGDDAIDRPNGFTRTSPLIPQKDMDAMAAIKAKEGPVPGDADYSPQGGGRSPDSAQDPLLSQKSGMGGLLQEQIGQQQEALDASQAAGKEVAGVQEGEAAALGKLPTYNDIVANYQAKDQKLAQSYADAKIDPEHFLHSMSTGSKILTGIGMVLSGMGSATTGQPSYAMQVVNDAIKRDVEAQQDDKSSKMNLWKMNREALGNDANANLATENQIKAGALAKLQAAQTRAVLPQEKLRAQQGIDALKQNMLQNNMVRGLLTQGQQGAAANGGGALSGADPSMLVPEMVKDPGQQKQVYDEIKGRQNIARNGQKMLDTFDQAAKDTSGVVGRPLSAAYTPGSVIQLKQLMLPNFDKIDSTVRQATMDASYHDIVPDALDTDDRKAKKKQALKDWMNSNMSAPVSKGNYIDLDRFQSTAAPNFSQPSAPAASAQPQTIERRAKDGRIIVYDANTKQPIGVKK